MTAEAPPEVTMDLAIDSRPNAADPYFVAPGGRLELDNLAAGDHRFMCCIHPWMRALIKVE